MNKARIVILCYVVSFNTVYSNPPDPVAERIDVLSSSTPLTTKIDACAYGTNPEGFIVSVGVEAVPLVVSKLLTSFGEGASPQAIDKAAALELPASDYKRTEYQNGLLGMLLAALREIPLDAQLRNGVLEAVYKGLQSPYVRVRHTALYVARADVGLATVDHVLSLLNDVNGGNRYLAAETLGVIGKPADADRVEQVLEKRRQGLSPDAIEKDGSFAVADNTVRKLRERP